MDEEEENLRSKFKTLQHFLAKKREKAEAQANINRAKESNMNDHPQSPVVQQTYGQVLPKNVNPGEYQVIATVNNDKTKEEMYGLCLHKQMYMPLVIDLRNGQTFVLEWSDILKLAIQAGIEKELPLAPEAPVAANEPSILILPPGVRG